MPLPREGMELDYSRWMQNLIGILQLDVTYFKGILETINETITKS